MKLDKFSRDLYTIVLPWGKYCYNSVPMGVASSPELSQRALGNLFLDMENILFYLDDILLVSKGP